jgi:hypothetical protein
MRASKVLWRYIYKWTRTEPPNVAAPTKEKTRVRSKKPGVPGGLHGGPASVGALFPERKRAIASRTNAT